MGIRLLIAGALAVLVGCKSTVSDDESKVATGPKRATAAAAMEGRDAVERALLSLGVDGAILQIDLGQAAARSRKESLKVAQAHLLDELLVLESADSEPSIYALERNGLRAAWVSKLREPSLFPATESADTLLFVSANYLHAFRALTGERAMQFVGGELDGLERPPLELHFTPTASAAAQQDTVYVPSLGSPYSNKTLESFSLVSGKPGWGYRTIGRLVTPPLVSRGSGGPKLYMATDVGVVTCIDAENYAYTPKLRWETRLDAGTDLPMFLTDDTKAEVGALFVVDREGQVYCLDRITGERRWTHVTNRRPMGAPMAFGDFLCVRMKSGLFVFDRRNVLYALDVVEGLDAGKSFRVRPGRTSGVGRGAGDAVRLSDARVREGQFTLEVQGELLVAMVPEEAGVRVDGRPVSGRVVLLGGQTLRVGGTTFRVTDRRTEPLLADLAYDRAVGRIGDALLLAKGNALSLVDAWTGEVQAGPVTVPGARFIPANTKDANLYVVVGDAKVYALFPR